jgi:hypothetical protein
MAAPVDYVAIDFGADPLPSSLVAALIDLVGLETIRLLDMLVVSKAADGTVSSVEIDDIDDPQVQELFYDLGGEYGGLVSEQDIQLVAESVDPSHTVVVIIWENLWADRFAALVRANGGEILIHERIPAADVDRALSAVPTDDRQEA